MKKTKIKTCRKSVRSPKNKKKEEQKTKEFRSLKSTTIPSNHDFSMEEVSEVRLNLLQWYDKNKRDLPWRNLTRISDINERAYAVWVSEIMLQQTKVATVTSYYEKWMKLWPNIRTLSKATLEEVNQAWSGLGYYSRGRRLHEGAKIISEQWNGEMPSTAEKLQILPGIGRYTAAAIASIAFNEVVGTVDGNVFRVISRLRRIGKEISSPDTIDATWFLINKLIDPERPGDFNQAMMELGATICIPKNPLCHSCPVQSNCKAYLKVENSKESSKNILFNTKSTKVKSEIADIEECIANCQLCLSDSNKWDSRLGVENYPQILKKQPSRKERTSVMIIFRNKPNDEFYLVQRPKTGLLANLWEFPTVLLEEDKSELSSKQNDMFVKLYGLKKDGNKKKHIGEVVHIFSHIHQTYVVDSLELTCEDEWDSLTLPENYQGKGWFTKESIETAAISTAMRKVFSLFESKRTTTEPKAPSGVKKRKRGSSSGDSPSKKKQTTLGAFFRKRSS